MNLISLLSVRHTGQHFCTDHLFKDWRSVSPKAQPDREFDCYILCHLGDSLYESSYADFITWPVVMPLRAPKALVESHTWRYEDFYWLSRELDRLDKLDKVTKISYLPLDSSKRNQCLAQLNKRLGTTLQTDWPVIRERTDRKECTIDQGEVDWVWNTYGHIFGRFYERD